MAEVVNESIEHFQREFARHAVRFSDASKPFVARLSRTDRDAFLTSALEAAEGSRSSFDPDSANVLVWWAKCLRKAALSKTVWILHYSTGKQEVLGRQLGRLGSLGEY